MTPDDSEDLLFASLLDMPESERVRYLAENYRDEPTRRLQIIEKLEQALRSIDRSCSAEGLANGRYSDANAARVIAIGLDVHEKPGTFIGRYQLVQKIGEGGCGVVYLAEQQEPVRRQVALKLIKLGLDTREFVARFEAERQALAMMEHPNIARVFDGGATDVGRPFFVMELVRGVPITRYCDENKLSVAERLRLFVAVCQAVQHAHQKGIIHRDLKPSNILVAVNESGPVPKIIDFGIAKAMEVPLTDKSLVTHLYAFVGTPAYTSPEQIERTEMDVDTRSDIYSLGVLLYELLTGHPPFDSESLLKSGLEAMRRTVREVDPQRPSQLIATLGGQDRTAAGRQRGTDPSKLMLLLRGDLDWIVMRCLEKDRARRYPTASALAVDIECYLNDELVSARPPSNTYRIQKIIRRHRAGFAFGAAVFFSLLAGLIVSSALLVRERRSRERAVAAERSETISRKRAEEGESKEALRSSRTAIDLAEQHFIQGHTATGLAYLVWAGRKDPQSRIVAPRLLSALATRGFFLPEGPPLAFATPAQEAFFTNDGSELFVVGKDSSIRVVDAASGRLAREFHYGQDVADSKSITFSPVSFSANNPGIFAARFVDDTVLVCDLKTGKPRTPPILLGEKGPRGPWLSPDGRWVAISGISTAKLFDTRTGELRATLSHPGAAALMSLTFSPDSSKLVTTQLGEMLAHLWSVPDGVLLCDPIKSERGQNQRAAFSPDGRFFAVASTGAQIYSTGTGKKVGDFLPHNESVWSIIFTPDGRRLVTSSVDHVTKIWDVATGTLAISLNNGGDCRHATFSDDGSKLYLVFKSGDGELWDLNTRERLAATTTLGSSLFGRAWSFDGRCVVGCTADGRVYRLRLGGGSAQPLSLPIDRSFRGVALIPDEPTHFLWFTDVRARVLDVASGREIPGGFAFPTPNIRALFPRRDLRVMLVRIHPNQWQSWWFANEHVAQVVPMPDLGSDEMVLRPVGFEGRQFLFSPTGDRVALLQGNARPHAKIFNLRSGESVGPALTFDAPVYTPSANFDPLGRYLAIGGLLGSAKIWDVVTGNLAMDFKTSNRTRSNFVLFSPDAGRVVISNTRGETQIWDAKSGRTLSPVFDRPSFVWSAEYSRNGTILVTGDWEGNARVWNALTGVAMGATMIHSARVSIVHFSPDGKRILTASADGTARVWDALTGQPLTEPLQHGEELVEASFNSDGRFILTRAGATQRVWSVPTARDDSEVPDWLLELGTLCASKSLTPDGQLTDAPDQAGKIDDLRRRLTSLPDNAPYVEWGRWFLADPAKRAIAPGFNITSLEADRLANELTPARAP